MSSFPPISLRIWISVRITLFFSIRGKILLEEDKDILLDKWRLVKGGLPSLTEAKKNS